MHFASSKFIFFNCKLAELIYIYKGWRIAQKAKYINSQFESITKNKLVVVKNDELCQCGGLCDRLHGILSVYSIVKPIGSEFKISFSFPSDLRQCLIPNQVDWSINEEAINYRNARVLHVPLMTGRFHVTLDEEYAFHKKYLSSLLRKNGNKIIYTNTHLVKENVFRDLFNELFSLSSELKDLLTYHLSRIGRQYLGVCLRFRNLLGDFYEPGSVPLSQIERTALINKCMKQLRKLHSETPQLTMFVASDSAYFCDLAQNLDFVYVVGGERCHPSYDEKSSIMESFLDLMLLSKAQTISLLLTGDMYRSSFAETASYIGNIPYKEISF